MASTLLLGVDLGTSGVKALLLPPEGGDVTVAIAPLPLSAPRPGWSEQDPAWWWSAAVTAIRDVVRRRAADPGDIAALALSGQMHGATLLDARGGVLRPCILWNDARSGAQCRAITDRLGLETLVRWVGNPALAGFTAPKLLWLREHEPETYARLATVLLPKDYLNYRLTGAVATDVSDASGTLLFDVAQRRWSGDMLHALDLPAGILPPVHEPTAVIGRLTPEAAAATGLRAGTPVVAGGADNACSAIGVGVVAPGATLVSLGTSGTVLTPTAELVFDPQARLHSFCHAVPGVWYLMGVVLSAGGSLRWYRDVLAADVTSRAEAAGEDAYDLLTDLAAEAPPGSEGLFFLPYLTGERTPHGDPDARGAFVGLSPRHGRPHLARAVLEGITFALADSVALMRAMKLSVDTVRATGGGARSDFWRGLLADVLDAGVVRTAIDEGPAYGAAILAGVGIGVFPSIDAAAARLVRRRDELAPDPARHEIYRRYHRLFDALYPALREQFAEVAIELGQQVPPDEGLVAITPG